MTTSDRQQFAKILWVVTALYALLLAYLLLTPDPWWFMGETGDALDETISSGFEDYIQHAGVFIPLACLTGVAQWLSGSPSLIRCILATGIFAILGEALQAVIPNRYAGMVDGLANLAGVTIGWASILLARLLFAGRGR